ncbi:MAG: thiamine diphosphokinase [Vallitalea sp.]|jgi:thiamine pyrophosphokinase|nr:thiamine diphosphokinase [Vallitalea sp.]
MKTLIVTGGSVDISYIKSFMKSHTYDYIIGVDKGLEYLYELELIPNLIIGDFDSANKQVIEYYKNSKVEFKNFISEKDETDTHLAILEAINVESIEIDIIGGIGSRIDHTLANIHILMIPLKENINCRLINKNNIIRLVDSNISIKKNEYKYISLIPLTSQVVGITTDGLKYELNDYNMNKGISIGISNELIQNVAHITIREGILIVINSRD